MRRPRRPARSHHMPADETIEPPDDLVARLPHRLSPSRASDFLQCPRLFYYKTILGLATPGTIHTVRGTLVHLVAERLFDLPRGERTRDAAIALIRPCWDALAHPAALAAADPGSDAYRHAAEKAADLAAIVGPDVEAEFLDSVVDCINGWFAMEDPNRFDPIGVELHLQARLLGVTMHGLIDRLDRIEWPDGSIRYIISDYKTGKVPADRYLDKAFFALRVYAALLFEMCGIVADQLRLVYVRAGRRDAVKTQPVTPATIEATKRKVDALWRQIVRAAERRAFAPNPGPLCDWCHFRDVCPAFNPELSGIPVSFAARPLAAASTAGDGDSDGGGETAAA